MLLINVLVICNNTYPSSHSQLFEVHIITKMTVDLPSIILPHALRSSKQSSTSTTATTFTSSPPASTTKDISSDKYPNRVCANSTASLVRTANAWVWRNSRSWSRVLVHLTAKLNSSGFHESHHQRPFVRIAEV